MADRGDIVEQDADPVVETEDKTSTARNFRVVARSALDARILLRDRAGVHRGVVYRSMQGEAIDASMICRSVSSRAVKREAPLGGLADYDVKAVYETRKSGGKEEPAIGGPPVYGLDVSLLSVPVDVDYKGRALVMSSLEPFDPPETDTEAQEVFPVEWWLVSGSTIEAIKSVRGLANSLNAEEWLGAPRGSVFCLGVRKVDETVTDGGRVAVKFSARFEYRRPLELADLSVKVVKMNDAATAIFGDTKFITATQADVEGFDVLRADRGRRTIAGADDDGFGEWKPIVRGKRDVTGPVDLDGAGNELKDGMTKVAILVRKKRRYVDFRAYGV